MIGRQVFMKYRKKKAKHFDTIVDCAKYIVSRKPRYGSAGEPTWCHKISSLLDTGNSWRGLRFYSEDPDNTVPSQPEQAGRCND